MHWIIHMLSCGLRYNNFSTKQKQSNHASQILQDDEVNAPASENRYDQEIDFADKTLIEWKELIFNEVQRYQADHDIFTG